LSKIESEYGRDKSWKKVKLENVIIVLVVKWIIKKEAGWIKWIGRLRSWSLSLRSLRNILI
jgi:hypothetical protein